MAREYTRGHEYYMPLQDMQPPAPHYVQYDAAQTVTSSSQLYELTPAVSGGGGSGGVVGGSGGVVGGSGGVVGGTGGVVGSGAGSSGIPGASGPPNQPPPNPTLATLQPMQPAHVQHGQRKRKSSTCTENSDMSGCDSLQTPVPPYGPCAPRKRKLSSFGSASAYDDDGEDTKSLRSLSGKKQNHSEIEKRRRDKMNTYIMELSSMVPMCGAMARKLDKLTVLRMAVQHLRSIRGALSVCPLSARPRPSFVSEKELNAIILEAGHDCFLLVVGCDRGRLLFVSASVNKMLHYEQSELLGQSLFDILHPKDVAKVKEQLSSPDLSPRERLIDAKTMLPLKPDVVAGASRLCPGARRSFFCRIKCKLNQDQSAASMPVKEETEANAKMRRKQSSDKKYCVVQCTGYLKSWAPAEISEGGSSTAEVNDDGEANNVTCLVAVVRALPDLIPDPYNKLANPSTRQLQYVSRHAPDGKFLFVDQRVTLALGFLPQELLGTSLYEYVSGPELGAVARTHKSSLLQRDALHTPPYNFRRKDGVYARIQTYFKPFKNPWTKDVECLVAQNTMCESDSAPECDAEQTSFDMFKQKADLEMQRLIDSQVESHKIGSAIAEEVLRRNSTGLSPDLPVDLLHDAVFNQQWQLTANVMCEQATLADNILGGEISGYNQVRNNVPLSSAGPACSPPQPNPEENIPPMTPPISPPIPTHGLDGNGEAAMAVIMSLLEADAGLGGPVNFSGLPWPLP